MNFAESVDKRSLYFIVLNAIQAMEKVICDNRYEPSSNVFHKREYGKCAVCLAGAVMAKILSVPATRSVGNFTFENGINAALRALSHVRKGQIAAAYSEIGYQFHDNVYPKFKPFDGDFHGRDEAKAFVLELLEFSPVLREFEKRMSILPMWADK